MDSLAYECFQTGNTFLQIVDVLVGHLYEVCESVTEFRVGEAADTTLRIFRVFSSFGQCLEKCLAQSYTSGFTARRQVGVGSMLSRSSLCRARCI